MAEMDILGINLEGYFELSFIIIDKVDLDANVRIMLNCLCVVDKCQTNGFLFLCG
jgi:hypothetical protein